MRSTPRKASAASRRNWPCVSEMTPTIIETWLLFHHRDTEPQRKPTGSLCASVVDADLTLSQSQRFITNPLTIAHRLPHTFSRYTASNARFFPRPAGDAATLLGIP